MQDVATELAALDHMSTGELAERYRELHGQPCRTRHKAYLIDRRRAAAEHERADHQVMRQPDQSTAFFGRMDTVYRRRSNNEQEEQNGKN